MSSFGEQYWKYQHEKDKAARGERPSTYGLSSEQSYDLNNTYNNTVSQQAYDRAKEASESYSKLLEDTMNGNQGNSTTGNTISYGGAGIGLLLFVLLIIWLCTKDFSCNQYMSSPQSQQSRLDLVDDPSAAAGHVNIMENILLYDNKNNTIGSLKYGIPEDSLKLYLAGINIEKAKRKASWSGKPLVRLSKIPAHWIEMEKGQKKVREAWTLEFMLHNFVHVDSATYRKIRVKNFSR